MQAQISVSVPVHDRGLQVDSCENESEPGQIGAISAVQNGAVQGRAVQTRAGYLEALKPREKNPPK